MPDGAIQAAIEEVESFSNLDLVIFLGCHTGESRAYNSLPMRMVQKGTQNAVGFHGEIDCEKAKSWLESFYGKLLDNKSIAESVEEASKAVGWQDIYCFGYNI